MLSRAFIPILVALVTASSAAHAQSPSSGNRFFVERVGSGNPVIYIPGLTSVPDVFLPAAKDAGGEAHLITVAGFGGTSRPDPVRPVIEPLVLDIVAYLDQHDISGASIVGHSMGGLTAMLVASESERVEKVLVIDAVPFLPKLRQPQLTPDQAESFRPMMQAQFSATSDEQFMQTLQQGLPIQSVSEENRERIYRDAQTADLEVTKAALLELSTTDYSPELADLDATLVVLVPFDSSAGFDRDVVISRYEDQYAVIPGAKLKVIEDSRHFIMLDQPEAFETALREFLTE